MLKRRLPSFKKVHINTFPAIHFKKMDWIDFSVKFSSEIFVLVIAFVVTFLNWHFFTGSGPKQYSDNSMMAKFLSYHPEKNPKLIAKNSTIVTTVAKTSGFIAKAQADELEGLNNSPMPQEQPQDADLMMDGSGESFVNRNPDSVEALIAKQVKIYETQKGDTLKAIAIANGISTQTIVWANNLPNENIKPGWFLLILPTDGVYVKANSNTTLPDIAKKYSANLEKIIAYNGLENAEDIDVNQIIIVPGGSIPTPPAPKPKPKPVVNNSGKTKGDGPTEDVEQSYLDDGKKHIFPKGYCTWYVAQKVRVPWGGNAKNWLTNAKAYGAVISNTPAVGAIVVTTENKRYGHVAYIEQVEAERFLVSEMNYEKFGKMNYRWISNNSKVIRGFIHP